ncbi:sensor histidine kinase [Lachnoclostridium phocaeense]|uniref:sensor histidine kinase n=1 Tax=Lachnoclostridium phocaeense TaxID=1871021 RepID=UPI00248E8501|nr:sensor histidine kinase [Lachnoclostridium phocaeense]
MKTFGYYLKEIRRPLAVYAGTVFIFALVGYLYEVTRDAVGYALLLSAVILLVCTALDLARYLKRERRIEEIRRNLPYADPMLPGADTLAEREYQEMLTELLRKRSEEKNDAAERRQESMDYYSLWGHQIKTPIAAMRLLLQEEERERQGKDSFLREMYKELFRTEQYVEMVMTYLRIGDISQDMVLSWYPLDDLIRQAVRKYSRLFIIQKLKLDFKETDSLVLTDEKWLVFVIEQILSNALKYTKEGAVSIYAQKDGPSQIALVIADTGIGIAQEDLPRVFERGFTGYNGREYKKSTGIGLYLCRRVMDRLGHGMRIQSAPGEGTKVFLDLGRKPVEAE